MSSVVRRARKPPFGRKCVWFRKQLGICAMSVSGVSSIVTDKFTSITGPTIQEDKRICGNGGCTPICIGVCCLWQSQLQNNKEPRDLLRQRVYVFNLTRCKRVRRLVQIPCFFDGVVCFILYIGAMSKKQDGPCKSWLIGIRALFPSDRRFKDK